MDEQETPKDDKLSKALGLQPIDLKKQIEIVVNNTTDDVEQAKKNIKEIIMKGKLSLDDLLDVARISEHPRAYEVAANFIRALVEANRELVDINVKEKESTNYHDNRQIHNHTYVGSTAELLKMMKEANSAPAEET